MRTLLGPDRTFLGTEHWKGYVVFVFERQRVLVLECPILGNAIYVLRADWRKFAGMSKQEILDRADPDVERIVHAGAWRERLRRAVA